MLGNLSSSLIPSHTYSLPHQTSYRRAFQISKRNLGYLFDIEFRQFWLRFGTKTKKRFKAIILIMLKIRSFEGIKTYVYQTDAYTVSED